MSKKSRKRNKKILAALALAGGAAMLGRGKGEISSNRPSGIDAALVASKAKDVLPEPKPITLPSAGGIHAWKEPKGEIAKRLRHNAAMNYQRGQTFDAIPRRGVPNMAIDQSAWSGYKKGGSAKRGVGIAKRGFGRALRGKK